MIPPSELRRALPTMDLSGLATWLVERGLRGLPLDEQVEGFCHRVVDAGFPARRFSMSIGMLHPRHGARSYVWRPSGLETEDFARQQSSEERVPFLQSPIHYLQSSSETSLRRRLDTDTVDDFPVLADRRAEGMTDYAAWVVPFDDSHAATLPVATTTMGFAPSNPMQGIFFSCTTDVQGGFDDAHLSQLAEQYVAMALLPARTYGSVPYCWNWRSSSARPARTPRISFRWCLNGVGSTNRRAPDR